MILIFLFCWYQVLMGALFFHRSMLPVPPAVGPAFSFELDVEDGEVENYEVSYVWKRVAFG